MSDTTANTIVTCGVCGGLVTQFLYDFMQHETITMPCGCGATATTNLKKEN